MAVQSILTETLMDAASKIKPSVRALEPYDVKGKPAKVKLNQNENPFDLPIELKDEILAELKKESWNRYPEVLPYSLIDKLSEVLRFPANGIIVSNGSNELIYTIFMATVTCGVKVLIPTPTFFLYEKAVRVMEGDVVSVPMKDDLAFDTERILDEAKRTQPGVIVISSPNNPTGQSMPYHDVEMLLETTDAIVLIDEAYIEFSDKKGCFDLLDKYENVIILRTFSKAFSLAGLRIGYILTNSSLRKELLKPKIPFTVNRLSSLIALKLLDHRAMFRKQVEYIKQQKQALYERLRNLDGVQSVNSDTNFVLFKTPKPSSEVFDKLLEQSVLVRDVSSYPMLENTIRVNAGTEEENQIFLASLKKILQGN